MKRVMQTSDIKEFYNTSLKASPNRYEHDRWFKNAQRKAGFVSTKSAVERYALPLIDDKTENIFELGPGPGTWTKLLLQKSPKAHYDLVDISEEMLAQAKESLPQDADITFIVSDILDFKPERSYDFFFSSRIIEYVPDKDKAVSIIASSLKSGAYGYIVTKTPQQKRGFGTPITSPVHGQQVGPDELVALFEKHNCTVKQRVHVTCVFPGLRSGLADRLLTTICRWLPFPWCTPVSESYALVFVKK